MGGVIFRACPDQPWGPPSLLYNGYRFFPRGKERPGRDSDPSSPSSAVGHERVELYLNSPYGPCDLYRASVPVQRYTLLTVELYLYSPYGPYGLYRASVPVQGCTLLILTVELYLYFPMSRTACTEPQCLYKGDLYFYIYIYIFIYLYAHTHTHTHIKKHKISNIS